MYRRILKFFVLLVVCTISTQTISSLLKSNNETIVFCEKQEKEKKTGQDAEKDKILDHLQINGIVNQFNIFVIPTEIFMSSQSYYSLPEIPPDNV